MMIHVDQILLEPVDVVDCEGLGEEDEGENNTNRLPESCDCDCHESSKLSDEAEDNLNKTGFSFSRKNSEAFA